MTGEIKKTMNEKEDMTLFLAVEALLNNNMRTLREKQVMTSEEVAKLYEVTPHYLQQRIKGNPDRFPKDFMFRLTKKEQDTLKTAYPFVLTESGILMAGGLLRTEKARKIHVQFINYFIKLCKTTMEKTGVSDEDTFLIFELLKQMEKEK